MPEALVVSPDEFLVVGALPAEVRHGVQRHVDSERARQTGAFSVRFLMEDPGADLPERVGQFTADLHATHPDLDAGGVGFCISANM